MSSQAEPRAHHDHGRGVLRIPARYRRQPLAAAPVDLTVIIPVRNEAENLPLIYDELASALEGRSWELMIVDDGSTDDSYQVAAAIHRANSGVTVAKLRRNFGKTAALSAGISLARGRLIATLDGDLQDDPREIPRLLAALEGQDLDLVTGWRRRRNDSLPKRISSRAFNGVVSRLMGVRLRDMNCGLKLCRAGLAKDLKLYGDLHRFLPVLAIQKGYRVGEIEVTHRPRLHGRSKYGLDRAVTSFLDIQTVLFLTRYLGKPLRLFGTAGLVLVALGVLAGLHLSWLHFGGHQIGSRPLLLLSALLVISGLQLFSTGLIGEMLQNISFTREREYSIAELLQGEPDQAEKYPGGDVYAPEAEL